MCENTEMFDVKGYVTESSKSNVGCAEMSTRSNEVDFPYHRIAIVGTSGSGKSTLARALANRLGCEHIELDAYYHAPEWKSTPDEIFIPRVQERLKFERWVCDGNYSNRTGQLDRADLIIWLDFPFRIILARVLRRTVRRIVRREELWNGNRETLRMAFSRESIIVWVFQTYKRRRQEFSKLQHSNKYPNAQLLCFQHPKEARQFLDGI
jgi:adenylate kinase family enzyme